MRSILVLANQTLSNPQLVTRLKNIVGANPVQRIHVTVPLSTEVTVGGRDDEAAQKDLDQMLAALADLDVELTGAVVGDDPVVAAHRAYEQAWYDLVVVSTLEAKVSRWLSMDVPHRIERRFGVQVEHVDQSQSTDDQPRAVSASAERPAEKAPVRSSGPARILLVEDNDADYVLTERAMERTGIEYELKRTREGASALEYFRTNGTSSIDLVLLDLRMPVMSGFELLEAAGAEFDLSELNIVVLTTSSAPEDRRRSHELGAAGYVVKESDFDKFQHTLHSLLTEASLG